MQAEGRSLTSNFPEELPEWISAFNRQIGITIEEGRITLTSARTEVFNYFPGWEPLWFTL